MLWKVNETKEKASGFLVNGNIKNMQMPAVLYHGSPVAFKRFDLSKAFPLKDYGAGFYLTSCYEQAVFWANKKRVKAPCAYVYEYKVVSWEKIRETLHIKEFLEYDEEWAVFVAKHRRIEIEMEDGFDLVYDRMADSTSDDIMEVSETYIKDKSPENLENLLIVLSRQKAEYDQYCFKTYRSHRYLVCKRVAVISGSVEKPEIMWKEAKDFYEQQEL